MIKPNWQKWAKEIYGKFKGEETEMTNKYVSTGEIQIKTRMKYKCIPMKLTTMGNGWEGVRTSWPAGALWHPGLCEFAWPLRRAVARCLAESAVSTVDGTVPYLAPFPWKPHKKKRTRICVATSLVMEKLKTIQIRISKRLGKVRCSHRRMGDTTSEQVNLNSCCKCINTKNNVERANFIRTRTEQKQSNCV